MYLLHIFVTTQESYRGAAGTVIFPDRIDFSGQINIFCCKILSFPGVPDFCCADPNSSILLRGPPTRRFCCKTPYLIHAQIPATRTRNRSLTNLNHFGFLNQANEPNRHRIGIWRDHEVVKGKDLRCGSNPSRSIPGVGCSVAAETPIVSS